MAIYQGDKKISGNAQVSNLPLLTPIWQDHVVNNASFLRANNNSWHSADLYPTVYQHLVADITGITAETETISGTTITFYHAADDHKIILPDQETNADTIYAATDVAYYYVLDTTNQRFKLPRSKHGNIVEKYKSGNNWYRIWSDGWCEQGGLFVGSTNVPASGDYTYLVNLLKSYKGTDYTITVGEAKSGGRYTGYGMAYDYESSSYTKTTSSFHVMAHNYYTGGALYAYFYWECRGYVETPLENSQYKYLYYYVGSTIQNASLVDAGQMSEDLNDKADLDLGNLSNAGKIVGSDLGMPSSVYDNLTVVPNGGTYTAPANGYFCARLPFTGNQAFKFYNATQLLGNQATCNGSWTGYTFIPVQKGDVVYVYYNCTPDLVRFVYAEGSKSEQ